MALPSSAIKPMKFLHWWIPLKARYILTDVHAKPAFLQMRYKKFTTPKDGEWVQPTMKNYLMACCDCGLIHKLNFRIALGKETTVVGPPPVVQFQAFRHKAWTSKLRMMRAKRSGGNCLCGAIIMSMSRKKRRKP